MLKILLALLFALDAAVLFLLIIGTIAQIMAGGSINILLPGLGLIVSLSGLLILLFIVEMFLVTLTMILFRHIKNSSKLA